MSVYTAEGHIEGGREGRATAKRGTPDLVLVPPPAMGGAEGAEGTNPEELFALGYGACFLSTLQFVARSRKISAKAFTLDSTVDLDQVSDGFQLAVALDAKMPDVDPAVAAELMHEAHGNCVYSKAVSGNIEVKLSVDGTSV
jgi:lipoyl-dependent peroxiredoxin